MKGSIIIMKQKHLTLEEKETIEDMLKENINFTEIGKLLEIQVDTYLNFKNDF